MMHINQKKKKKKKKTSLRNVGMPITAFSFSEQSGVEANECIVLMAIYKKAIEMYSEPYKGSIT